MHKHVHEFAGKHPTERSSLFLKILQYIYKWVNNSIVKTFAKIAATIFFAVLVNQSLDHDDLMIIKNQIDIYPLSVAVIFAFLGYYFQIIRWRDILKTLSLPSSFKSAAKTLFIGFFLAFLTPGRVGEFFRGVNLCPERKKVSVIAVVVERFFAVYFTIVLGIISVLIQLVYFKIDAPVYFIFLLVAALLLLPAIVGLLAKTKNSIEKFPVLLRDTLNSAHTFLNKLAALPIKKLVLSSLLVNLCLIIQTAVLLSMFGSSNFFKNCVIATQVYAFMLFLPFFVANIGLREFSFTLFLRKIGTIAETTADISAIAFGVSSAILLLNIILPAILGLIWMFLGTRVRQIYFNGADNQVIRRCDE